jgi:DnaJ domain
MRRTVDYYAVLQVHPAADQEVIDAAYRQLMKKYHPDRAGDDPRSAVEFHERAKVINEAYAVLRDQARRRIYDAQRLGVPVTPVAEPAEPSRHTQTQAPPSASQYGAAEYEPTALVEDQPSGILGALAAAYSALPGAYEWERGYRADAVMVMLVPVIGLMAWALATGRLNRMLGDAPLAPVVAWVLLGALLLPLLRMAPRLLAAVGPSGLLVSGMVNSQLAQAHVPTWLAWFAATLLGLTLAPRVFVFGVLPTLGLYLLLARFA